MVFDSGLPILRGIRICVDLIILLPVLALGVILSASLCNLSFLVGIHGSVSSVKLSTLFPSLVVIVLMVASHLLLSLVLLKFLLAIVAVLIRLLRLLSFIILSIFDHHGVILMALVSGLTLLVAFGKKSLGLILFIAIT